MFADEQKLPAHLGKAGTAKFLVEQFEYGGHCHPHRWNSSSEICDPAGRLRKCEPVCPAMPTQAENAVG
ncbi:hypothetical protein L6654_19325 [Bradyrhizobium sp. WYCCWR 13023]|uniref:Uncharacterized protein n=1 Tax=Bradyrhizobium zhengyangense TaxID=2911009 RepID=A0A9X1RAD2_9BRAD|nr:hypothetical protein [Bradyrhizobium zhengyangense]MCG2628791.1 hypothetical protein [Bradyrhizobium zhengyangense]MCG2645305.1 hypothetical protein [Bradyrhizobium zhengyangense]MCG2668372.1 hypothetical protein [Bradyrhizobium zhengyangense]